MGVESAIQPPGLPSLQSHLALPKYRPDIDGLRAVAVLSVVAFHAFPDGLKGGFTGVDVFFVISGYLISTIIFQNLERGTFSFAEFYARRIRRIFPALLLVLVASGAFGWFALLTDEYKQLGKHVAAGAGFVSNLVLWSEVGYFDNSAQTKPLLHLWSLGIEEQFYIVWPLLLWLGWKRKISLVAITMVVAVVSFGLNVSGKDAAATFYAPQTRFWELSLGSLLAWSTLHGNGIERADGKFVANGLAFLGSCLLVYGFWQIDKDSTVFGPWLLAPVLGAVLIIAAGPQAWVNRAVLSNRLAVWFGLISFPLYLWHWPLLSFAQIVQGGVPARNIRISAVALSVVLAWLTYELVERPVRRGQSGKSMTVCLVLLVGLTGYVGYRTYDGTFWASREHIKLFEQQRAQFVYVHDLGRPAGARVMLLGDSHAQHLVAGLKKELGGLVADYTSNGCIPFYDVDRYDSRSIPGDCQEYITRVLTAFEKTSAMDGIILSSMGPVYLTGEAFNGMDDARVTGSGVTLATRPDLTDRWEIYREGLTQTLTRLSSAGKNIIFVIDVPELGFDPRSCFDSRPLVISSVKRPVCAVPRADYDARAKRYKELVYGVLKNFPKVKVYDPTDDFCDRQWCWAIRGKKMLYRNADHLSNEGSYFIAQRLAPLITGRE